MSTSRSGNPGRPRKPAYRVVAPDRYVRAEPASGRVTVSLRGRTLADSARALALYEGDRAPVWYLPAADVAALRLLPSERAYACRWKGDATCFHVVCGDERIDDGAWTYADPPTDLAAIAGYLAFDDSAFEVRCDGADASGGDDSGPASPGPASG